MQQKVETKKNEQTNMLTEFKRLREAFGFTGGMLVGLLAEGQKKV